MPRHVTLPILATALAAAAAAFACSDGIPSAPDIASEFKKSATAPTITPQETGTIQRFFAVSPVNDRVVWASARGGTFSRTTDGGATWVTRVVPGAETMEFRDVEGVSAREAYLMSAGTGPDNRIYKTEDGGDTWTLQFQATDPRAFYDCFDFWTPNRGLTYGDSYDGQFPVLRTRDGENWENIGDNLPAAQPGEGGFAASGTCIKTLSGQSAWIGTGAAARARVLATRDGGDTWASYDVPIQPQGTPTSGVVSIDFRDRFHGILGGGDVVESATPQLNVARSDDGGATWTLTTPTPFSGAVYGLSYVGQEKETVVATGPSGSAWTSNEGDTWTLLPGITNCWAVGFARHKTGWLGCGAGRIFRIDF
jgi:photosystem II stability/assembly factor-like uncharacterized protein